MYKNYRTPNRGRGQGADHRARLHARPVHAPLALREEGLVRHLHRSTTSGTALFAPNYAMLADEYVYVLLHF